LADPQNSGRCRRADIPLNAAQFQIASSTRLNRVSYPTSYRLMPDHTPTSPVVPHRNRPAFDRKDPPPADLTEIRCLNARNPATTEIALLMNGKIFEILKGGR